MIAPAPNSAKNRPQPELAIPAMTAVAKGPGVCRPESSRAGPLSARTYGEVGITLSRSPCPRWRSWIASTCAGTLVFGAGKGGVAPHVAEAVLEGAGPWAAHLMRLVDGGASNVVPL